MASFLKEFPFSFLVAESRPAILFCSPGESRMTAGSHQHCMGQQSSFFAPVSLVHKLRTPLNLCDKYLATQHSMQRLTTQKFKFY
jgi:hypothetical protein